METVELRIRLQQALDFKGKKAIDMSKDLKIPKSAISQYLSGKSKNMPSQRLHLICKYLGVCEAWMMGYDVPMERRDEKKSTANSGLSEKKQELINFLETVPDNKVDYVIRIMQTILQDEK